MHEGFMQKHTLKLKCCVDELNIGLDFKKSCGPKGYIVVLVSVSIESRNKEDNIFANY